MGVVQWFTEIHSNGFFIHQKQVNNMRHLVITTPKYIQLETSFKEWLLLLGYSKENAEYMPVMVREFFYYLEQQDIISISEITGNIIEGYFFYLSTRPSYTKEGALHQNTLLNHRKTLAKLSQYLQQTGQPVFEIPVRIEKQIRLLANVFTREEIQKLYAATQDNLMGYRDRAILAVYYGCGLRKNEGAGLKLSDILFDKARLYVRKGKGYQERYVPMSEGVMHDLKNYIDYARPMLLAHRAEGRETEASLFLTDRGNPIKKDGLYFAFKRLLQRTGIEKEAGLHTLRHSIATHLLQSGMKIERIAEFLGHSSLKSTEIYTHIMQEAGL
jgi:site-specific recombinase XerD